VAHPAIQNMFHLVHGPRSQHGKVAAVIAGYFDESNSHSGAKVLTLCGFLADPRIWTDFDQDWNKILDKPCWPSRPREFHTVDCVHGTNEFDGWKLPERLAIYGDMVTLLCETNLIAIGSGIVIDAFDSLSVEHKELLAKGGFFQPLDLVFQCDLQFAIDATVQYGKTHSPPVLDDLGLLFDESPTDAALSYHRIYAHVAAKHRSGKILSGIGFGKSEKYTPLQAADVLAYTTGQWLLKEYLQPRNAYDFPILPAFERLIENVAAAGGMFTERAMMTLIGQELINKANKEIRF
jgi:hypothetical protein